MSIESNEVKDLMDVEVPSGELSAEQVLNELSEFDAKRLAGKVGEQFARELKRAGISRAAGKKTTPMHEACICRNVEALGQYVTKKNCDRPNRGGMRPQHAAIINGANRCLELLLEKGADVTRETPAGSTSVHLAAICGGPALSIIKKHCRQEGISLDLPDAEGRTPLMMTISYRRYDGVFSLARDGADPHASSNNGDTPMQIARINEFWGILETLEVLS